MNKVSFAYAETQFNFTTKTKLKKLVQYIFSSESCEMLQVQYIFCTDDYLLEINQSFLQHSTYTDIITFPLQEKNNPIEGEIYISIDRVKENAKAFETNFSQELLRVVSHGALHLCGYKDKTKAQQVQMRAKEEEYINYYLNNLA